MRTDHTIAVLDEAARRAPTAGRKDLHALTNLLASLIGAHRAEIAALGIDDAWDAEFERAHAHAETAVSTARDVLTGKAQWTAGLAAPALRLEIPQSTDEARRIVSAGFDYEGRATPIRFRLAIAGVDQSDATLRWGDTTRDALVIATTGADLVVKIEDVLAVSAASGLALVIPGPDGHRLVELRYAAEAA